MKIAFSTNNSQLLSFLIRWGTSEKFFELAPVSHVLFVFDDKLVFHSNLTHGVHIQNLYDFEKQNKIVECFKPKKIIALEDEEVIYQELLKVAVRKSYDASAMIGISWAVFKRKFFGTPIPTDNPWNLNDQFFCVETLALVNQACAARLGFSLFPELESSMIDPWTLMQRMRDNSLVEPC